MYIYEQTWVHRAVKANSENSDSATENVRMDSGDEDKLVVISVWKQAIADANQANSCPPKRRQIAFTLRQTIFSPVANNSILFHLIFRIFNNKINFALNTRHFTQSPLKIRYILENTIEFKKTLRQFVLDLISGHLFDLGNYKCSMPCCQHACHFV